MTSPDPPRHEDEADTRDHWDRVAEDWHLQVGHDGDKNRRLNSDPVLWRFAGDVRGRTVLDAGAGTGYLSRQLHRRGAHVIAVDLSEKMRDVALRHAPELDYRVDSCSELRTVADESIDLIIANYVLMDLPDLDAAVATLSRVLKPAGHLIAVFSHPCFSQGNATVTAHPEAENATRVTYVWDYDYFQPSRRLDPAWAHFTSDFIWFHRPLSDYWKAFRAADLQVVDMEEPRLTPDRAHLAPDEKSRRAYQTRPYSIAFKLQKTDFKQK